VELAEIEPEEEGPRRGTLPWLQAQTHVSWEGLDVPAVHRIPEGSARWVGEDDGKCCVIRPDGRRCGASRVRLYGVCSAHLGGGDPEGASRKAVVQKARIKARRELLGIGPRTAANPRALARMAAQERAEEIAAALVDGPLDARDITALERQTAVIRALDATYPLQLATFEVELPADADAVSGLGWVEMQALAARLLEG
jgi:hypothetical protein